MWTQTAKTKMHQMGPLCFFAPVMVLTLPLDPGMRSAQADVTGITAAASGDVSLDGQFFLPFDDPGAHFSLDTLAVFETGLPPGAPFLPGPDSQVAWWDLEIKVTRALADFGNQMIAIDKDVTNGTDFKWFDFHMTLGTFNENGMFKESDENDLLFFKLNPAPVEESGAFNNPPMMDERIDPDNLWWFGPPGLQPGETAFFWLSINVPDGFFMPDPGGVTESAVFVLREHVSIPGPGTLPLLALSGLALRRRRRT